MIISNRHSISQLFNRLGGRLAQIADAQEAQELINTALGFSKLEVYTIEFCGHGPADGFKVFIDREGEDIVDAVYFYSDGSTYKEQHLTLEQLEKTQSFFEYLVNG